MDGVNLLRQIQEGGDLYEDIKGSPEAIDSFNCLVQNVIELRNGCRSANQAVLDKQIEQLNKNYKLALKQKKRSFRAELMLPCDLLVPEIVEKELREAKCGLDGIGLDACLIQGSLLQVMRDGRIAYWDGDIDVAIIHDGKRSIADYDKLFKKIGWLRCPSRYVKGFAEAVILEIKDKKKLEKIEYLGTTWFTPPKPRRYLGYYYGEDCFEEIRFNGNALMYNIRHNKPKYPEWEINDLLCELMGIPQ